jgi:hypothetical protein
LDSSEVTTVVLGARVVVVVLGATVVGGAEDVVVLSSATGFGATSPPAVDPPSAHADTTRARAITTMVRVLLTRILPADRSNTFSIGIAKEKEMVEPS